MRATAVCCGCKQQMEPVRVVAIVTHHYDPPIDTEMILFRCPTPDCGTELIVEGQ
jgi:hypothetical protein